MRLQLTVQRHGIPPVRVLWTVAPTRPPIASAGSSITVSQFLDQVNDIIPLESEEWGLEDYAVEVRGFECLHFSELGQVLKEDDEVCIRALQTTDLRVRRISGRHQISADGKHLIDGVAFGRPYLRRADRPAIRIPPRKRRRVTYDEEEDIDDGEEINDRQIVVKAGFDDVDGAIAGDESGEEEDFTLDDEDGEDLSAELADLEGDLNAGANGEGGITFGDEAGKPTQTTTRRSRRSLRGLGLLRLVDDNGQPFAGQYNNPLLDLYGQDEAPTTHTALKVKKRRAPKLVPGALKSARNGVQGSSKSPEYSGRRNSAGSNKSVRFEDAEPATPATIRESEVSDEADDDAFEPGEVDESDKENAEPRAEEDADSSDELSELSGSSSLTFSEESDSDNTSSTGSSSSDSGSESDSEPEQLPSNVSRRKQDSSETSSSGSSSSSSDSEPQNNKMTQKQKGTTKKVGLQPPEQKSESVAKASASKTTPPGKGKQSTLLRNQRRKKQKRLVYLKSKGILAPEATIADLIGFNESGKPEVAITGTVEDQAKEDDAELADIFNAKREALLTSIALGGINVSPMANAPEDGREAPGTEGQQPQYDELNTVPSQDEPMIGAPTNVADAEIPQHKYAFKGSPVEPQASGDLNSGKTPQNKDASEEIGTETPPSADGPNSGGMPTSSSQHRRSKLDLSGAKRMLFGSLGLRTPKTKQDESKTREKLMKDVRPLKEPQAENQIETVEDLEAIAADDSWKDKIDLRAVECCHDEIELSTPPFPFVQRWDPQQQRGYSYGNAKKRKGKKRKRNNDSYYEESSYQDSQINVPRHNQYEAPEGDSEFPTVTEGGQEMEEEGASLFHDESFQDSLAVNEQLMRETGEASAEILVGEDERTMDLPVVPEDPTTCLRLTREIAKEGTVIAFKQLEMSAETNWQPNISEYRTAVVDQVTDNGTLQMTPTKRDRPTKQIDYDGRTGERLYSKFEMPGFNEEDDNSMLEIRFDELISPILLRAARDLAGQAEAELDRAPEPIAADLPVTHDVLDQLYPGLDGAVEEATERKAIEPSEEAREEISGLIRDAGWRSSIQSGVNGDLIDQEGTEPPDNQGENEDTTLIDPPSPRFNGFSSSPHVNVRSSPPMTEAQMPKRIQASGTEIAESVPPQDLNDFDAKSAVSETKSAVEYPSLPQLGDDSGLFHDEAQRQSDPLFDHQILSQDLISTSMDQPPAQSTRSRTRPSQESSPPKLTKSFESVDSEDEFPVPFSQAWEDRMSQETNIKPDFSQGDIISPPAYKRSKLKGRHSSSQRESNRTWEPDQWSTFEDEEEDDGTSMPRPSRPQMSSQIVELTISSDTVDAPDASYNGDDDDSYRLPKGPGWVKKTRASRGRSESAKANSGQRKTKSR